jgi:hypothetical protein
MYTCKVYVYIEAKEGPKMAVATQSGADSIREHAVERYVAPARDLRAQTFSINVGEVHKALRLDNLVPSVCSALESRKFLAENHLHLISKTGPPSGKSTSVTYTYEFLEVRREVRSDGRTGSEQDAWIRLRGAMKDVFAALGGGETYLRRERDNFYSPNSGSKDRR